MPVIGIDAGATKTDCFLADETGAIVYQSRGPGANLQIMAAAAVEAVLGELIDEVLSGGLWKAVPGLKNEISRLVSKIAPRAQVGQLQVEPAVGAVTSALQSLS